MIVVNLKGGLGNQMFQYAFGKHLSIRTNQKLFLNIEVYVSGNSNRNYDLDIFDLSDHQTGALESINNILAASRLPINNISERFFHYDDELINTFNKYLDTTTRRPISHISVDGYWQSYKYFTSIEDVLISDFKFKSPLLGKWKILEEEIAVTESVAINVRRGDYLQKLNYHGVISIDYIKKGIEIIRNKVSNPRFYIFSDDIKWCRENIMGYKNMYFVDEQYYDSKYQYYLQMMCNCKYFIISNSSFSWWAAWLAKYQKKVVIAPKSWFTDITLIDKNLIPSKWIRI